MECQRPKDVSQSRILLTRTTLLTRGSSSISRYLPRNGLRYLGDMVILGCIQVFKVFGTVTMTKISCFKVKSKKQNGYISPMRWPPEEWRKHRTWSGRVPPEQVCVTARVFFKIDHSLRIATRLAKNTNRMTRIASMTWITSLSFACVSGPTKGRSWMPSTLGTWCVSARSIAPQGYPAVMIQKPSPEKRYQTWLINHYQPPLATISHDTLSHC